MINTFISMLLIIFTFSVFNISLRIQGVNRLVINAPLTIFEYTVIDKDNDVIFYREELQERYINYLERTIYQFVDNYGVHFRFYNPSDGGLCDEYCRGVEVKISADMSFSYTYHRTMFYEIKEVA